MKANTVLTVLLMVAAMVFAGYSARFWPQPATNTTASGGQGGVTHPEPIPDGVIQDLEYSNSTKEVGVEVYWHNNETHLFVGLISPGAGWVSLGVAPEDAHMGANYVFGNVSMGVARVCDEYGDGRYSHDPDVSLGGEDDVVDYAGSEGDNGTVIEFVIPLDSGDQYDKKLVPGSVYEAMVAYHSSSDDITQPHTKAGFLKLKIQ
jgi:hypothetical protein